MWKRAESCVKIYLQIESLIALFECTDCPQKNFSLSVLSDMVLLPPALLLVQQCDPAPVQVAQCNVLCFYISTFATPLKATFPSLITGLTTLHILTMEAVVLQINPRWGLERDRR